MSPKKRTFQASEVYEYEQKRYRSWDQKCVDRRERAVIEKLLDKVNNKTDKILDIPCGYGRFSALLKNRTENLVSSDISLAMVERTLSRRRKNGEGLPSGVTGDVLQGLPFQDGSMQGIFSMRLFHHIHRHGSRTRILQEYSRVAEDWVLCSFYQVNRLHQLQRRLRKKVKKSPTRIRMISQQEFAHVCGSAGFRVEASIPLFRGIHAQQIALLLKT